MAGRSNTFGAIAVGSEFKAEGVIFAACAQGTGTALNGTCKLQLFIPGAEVWIDLKSYTAAGFDTFDLGVGLKRLRWNQTAWTAGSFKVGVA